ncbi:hypothetical protein SAMN05444410_11963 [Hydrobacter penzbergensis]|uniref:Uncharacterized protein n=1 Tax=Hydrobacter penzbergensis TaxID=1235997 RepID=A0A8X8IHI9_9BACT|nr:hypothetical protein SAMN05444410_11963 [Hydrobacter penzbergensis]
MSTKTKITPSCLEEVIFSKTGSMYGTLLCHFFNHPSSPHQNDGPHKCSNQVPDAST